MAQITIAGTVINFPDSGASPNWAPAIIQFAQVVAEALRLSVGAFDVSPQVFNIDTYAANANVDIPNLSFDPTEVRAAFIYVTAFRNITSPTTSPATKSEVVELFAVYNEDNPTNEKWEFSSEKSGDASIEFNITDTGQVQFTTTSIGTGTHTGLLSYSARALTNS